MNDRVHRYALAACILIGLWIITYWVWPSSGIGSQASLVTFDDGPPREPAAQPQEPPAVIDPLTLDTPQSESEAQIQPEPAPEPEPRRVGVIPPRFTEYTVQRGDDFWTIADRVYGARGHWEAVAKANPGVDPTRLRAGQKLRIAVDPNNIQGLPADQDQPAPAPPSPNLEYVVARGDTLSGIAQSLYGRATLWRIILDANRDQLSRPEDVRPGMRLIIPPPPNVAGDQQGGAPGE